MEVPLFGEHSVRLGKESGREVLPPIIPIFFSGI
jgi:hypothetical protein